jgi:hypothetical protein
VAGVKFLWAAFTYSFVYFLLVYQIVNEQSIFKKKNKNNNNKKSVDRVGMCGLMVEHLLSNQNTLDPISAPHTNTIKVRNFGWPKCIDEFNFKIVY